MEPHHFSSQTAPTVSSDNTKVNLTLLEENRQLREMLKETTRDLHKSVNDVMLLSAFVELIQQGKKPTSTDIIEKAQEFACQKQEIDRLKQELTTVKKLAQQSEGERQEYCLDLMKADSRIKELETDLEQANNLIAVMKANGPIVLKEGTDAETETKLEKLFAECDANAIKVVESIQSANEELRKENAKLKLEK